MKGKKVSINRLFYCIAKSNRARQITHNTKKPLLLLRLLLGSSFSLLNTSGLSSLKSSLLVTLHDVLQVGADGAVHLQNAQFSQGIDKKKDLANTIQIKLKSIRIEGLFYKKDDEIEKLKKFGILP